MRHAAAASKTQLFSMMSHPETIKSQISVTCFKFNCLKHLTIPKSRGCNVLVRLGGIYTTCTFLTKVCLVHEQHNCTQTKQILHLTHSREHQVPLQSQSKLLWSSTHFLFAQYCTESLFVILKHSCFDDFPTTTSTNNK